MSNNVSVINIRKGIGIDLLTLNVGDIFKVDNVEYIVLDQLNGNQTAVIRKDLLEDTMEFDSDNNNWKTSSIRKFLNGKYLGEIEKVFGKDRVVEHTVDLLSMDGLDDYRTSVDKVSLLTIDQYRKYRRSLGINFSNFGWFLITPDSTPSGCSHLCVQYIDNNGIVDYCSCHCHMGIRPFFILQS